MGRVQRRSDGLLPLYARTTSGQPLGFPTWRQFHPARDHDEATRSDSVALLPSAAGQSRRVPLATAASGP